MVAASRPRALLAPALTLAQRYVQRWDLRACQLDDGSYVCVHERLNVGHLFSMGLQEGEACLVYEWRGPC
jgi:hypothetical protein